MAKLQPCNLGHIAFYDYLWNNKFNKALKQVSKAQLMKCESLAIGPQLGRRNSFVLSQGNNEHLAFHVHMWQHCL